MKLSWYKNYQSDEVLYEYIQRINKGNQKSRTRVVLNTKF